jgi:hypothetical protein
MNPNPPINQALIGIFQGNAAEIATRLTAFTDSRANLRKWHLPSYARYLEFPAYETQMKAIFHDAFIFDVVMGRALRTAPVAGEAQIITDKRTIYDECSLMVVKKNTAPTASRSLAGNCHTQVPTAGTTKDGRTKKPEAIKDRPQIPTIEK